MRALANQRMRHAAPVVLGAALLAAGIYALYRLLRPVHLADVVSQIRAISPRTAGSLPWQIFLHLPDTGTSKSI